MNNTGRPNLADHAQLRQRSGQYKSGSKLADCAQHSEDFGLCLADSGPNSLEYWPHRSSMGQTWSDTWPSVAEYGQTRRNFGRCRAKLGPNRAQQCHGGRGQEGCQKRPTCLMKPASWPHAPFGGLSKSSNSEPQSNTTTRCILGEELWMGAGLGPKTGAQGSTFDYFLFYAPTLAVDPIRWKALGPRESAPWPNPRRPISGPNPTERTYLGRYPSSTSSEEPLELPPPPPRHTRHNRCPCAQQLVPLHFSLRPLQPRNDGRARRIPPPPLHEDHPAHRVPPPPEQRRVLHRRRGGDGIEELVGQAV